MTRNTDCPRCGGGIPSNTQRGEYRGAMSRWDNETEICSACGQQEAMRQFSRLPIAPDTEGAEWVNMPSWPFPRVEAVQKAYRAATRRAAVNEDALALILVDPTLTESCTQCQAQPGKTCVTQSGEEKRSPHLKRRQKFLAHYMTRWEEVSPDQQ